MFPYIPLHEILIISLLRKKDSPFKSMRSLILITMRVILATYKAVLIRRVFGRSGQVRSFNCDMYWLLLNDYSEILGFRPGFFVLRGFNSRGKGLLLKPMGELYLEARGT